MFRGRLGLCGIGVGGGYGWEIGGVSGKRKRKRGSRIGLSWIVLVFRAVFRVRILGLVLGILGSSVLFLLTRFHPVNSRI